MKIIICKINATFYLYVKSMLYKVFGKLIINYICFLVNRIIIKDIVDTSISRTILN